MNGAALVTEALQSLTDALEAGDISQLKAAFLSSQAYWRDLLSFTFHFRTLNDGPTIAPALNQLAKERGLAGGFKFVPGSTHDVSPTSTLRWISGSFTFETANPKAKCEGSVQLLPEQGSDGQIKWKIWTLNTWLEDLAEWPEDPDVLTTPGRNLDDVEHIDTDVLIIGGGNA